MVSWTRPRLLNVRLFSKLTKVMLEVVGFQTMCLEVGVGNVIQLLWSALVVFVSLMPAQRIAERHT